MAGVFLVLSLSRFFCLDLFGAACVCGALLAAQVYCMIGTFFAYMFAARMALGRVVLSCVLHFQTFILGDEWIPAMSYWLSL